MTEVWDSLTFKLMIIFSIIISFNFLFPSFPLWLILSFRFLLLSPTYHTHIFPLFPFMNHLLYSPFIALLVHPFSLQINTFLLFYRPYVSSYITITLLPLSPFSPLPFYFLLHLHIIFKSYSPRYFCILYRCDSVLIEGN